MHHHTTTPRSKPWQFSIANLLAVISLVAITCAAFRFDITLGILKLHLVIAILITTVRTRATLAIQHELWDALARPDKYRRGETITYRLGSFGIALVAIFFFYVGLAVAVIPAAIIWDFMSLPPGPPRLFFDGFLTLLVFGTGILLAVLWLRSTWPRSYFTRPAAASSPSDKVN